MSLVLVKASNLSDCWRQHIRSRSWFKCLLDFYFLFLSWKSTFISKYLDLRWIWTLYRLLVIVVTWAWVQMTIWYAHVSSNLSSNPVWNILLIHGVAINVVLGRSWHVKVLRLLYWFYSEGKPRYFAGSIVWLSRITEIKITKELISVWCRTVSISGVFFAPFWCSESNASVFV